MSNARRNTGGSNSSNSNKPRRNNNPRPPGEPTPGEFWRTPPKAALPAPITPAPDATALLRSLGRPPLDHTGADRYLGTVAQRAEGLAVALAVAADILAGDHGDE
jgi:hypothetical protein